MSARRWAAGVGLTFLVILVAYAPTLGALADVWGDVSYYSYGYLVPLFSAYLIWEARRDLATPVLAWRPRGLAIIAAALVVLASGNVTDSLTLQALSLPAALAGLALFALPPDRVRAVAFPLAFLGFMAPLPESAVAALSLPLQHLAARVTEATLAVMQVPVVRDGLLLHLSTVTLHVTEACNGLRFLFVMIVLGTAFAATTQARAADRAAVFAGAVVLGIAANLVRVAGTAVLADAYGAEAAMGFFHLAYGKVVYLLALIPFLAVVVALRRRGLVAPAVADGPFALGDEQRTDVAIGRLETVSVVVPTKNRLGFLGAAVEALLRQTARIDELIVVDQSDDDAGRAQTAALIGALPAQRRPALVYVWDRSINGLAAARNTALDRARGDVVVFCDDDVVPAPDVIERLLAHYRREPGWAGLAPVIVNYEAPGRARRVFRSVFCRGPFHDERQPVYWFWRHYTTPTLVPVRMFTGAMMSFRRAAVADVRIDRRFRGASVGEDIDLGWALGRRGGALAIATDAHIVHNKAPRPPVRPEEALLTSWGFVYDKHVPKTLASRAAFAWFITGTAVSAALAAARERKMAPLRSTAAGLRALFNDYAGSSFLSPAARVAAPPGQA